MANKIGRNDACPCGSGKKYKQCCLKKPKPLGQRRFKATVLKQPPKPEASPEVETEEGPDLIARIHAPVEKPSEQ